MCRIDVDGYCEVWEEETRKARKEHKCDSCGSIIHAGERYVTHFDVFEGNANHEKCCMACDVDRTAFGDAHKVRLSPWSWEDYLRDCVHDGDDPSDESTWIPMLERLTQRKQNAKQGR